jgi:hypothetical protein
MPSTAAPVMRSSPTFADMSPGAGPSCLSTMPEFCRPRGNMRRADLGFQTWLELTTLYMTASKTRQRHGEVSQATPQLFAS